MNIEKLTKEIGSMDSEFIDEALDYAAERQRGGITMSKKKIAVLVAAVLTVCMAVSVTAAWEFFYKKSVPTRLFPMFHGSLKDGTAYIAGENDLSFKFEKTSNDELHLVITVNDPDKYPYNELVELAASHYYIYSADHKDIEDPVFLTFGWPETPKWAHDDSYYDPEVGPITVKNRQGEIYIVKGDVPKDYIFEVVGVMGYKKITDEEKVADGDWIEIQGDWLINFTF